LPARRGIERLGDRDLPARRGSERDLDFLGMFDELMQHKIHLFEWIAFGLRRIRVNSSNLQLICHRPFRVESRMHTTSKQTLMASNEEWANLTPREMMTCYEQVCKQYRSILAARPDVTDLDIR
jgi:hypothetical protein